MFLSRVFNLLDDCEVKYCLLRGFDEVSREGCIPSDVDLLVDPHHLPKLAACLARLGFVCLPTWGHSPHRFFVAYDPDSLSWVKLDVVDELVYGRPVRSVRIPLAQQCLERRVRDGSVCTLSPDDEFITLLLHCLFDKKGFSPKHASRLSRLSPDCDRGYLRSCLEPYLGATVPWSQVLGVMRSGRWNVLLEGQPAAFNRLFWKSFPATAYRVARNRLLRRMRPALSAMVARGLAIALLAPDGAGKTTLAQQLARDRFLRACLIYMGTNPEAVTVSLPTSRLLNRFAGKEGSRGLLSRGLRFCNRALDQWYRSAVALCCKASGRFVVFDRYVYDSCLASPATTLGRRIRRRILGSSWARPDLVILLDAPGEVLYARKREHSPERLDAQRQKYLSLQGRVPNIVVVDATREADQVRGDVIALIWSQYARTRSSAC